jgi:hypothetical protein
MPQVPLTKTASADHPEDDKLRGDKTRQIAPDLAYLARRQKERL